MAEPTHLIRIKIPEATYQATKQRAEMQGYLSLEEYVRDLLQSQAQGEIASIEFTDAQFQKDLKKADIELSAMAAMAVEEHRLGKTREFPKR